MYSIILSLARDLVLAEFIEKMADGYRDSVLREISSVLRPDDEAINGKGPH